jgi:hypothetical protein
MNSLPFISHHLFVAAVGNEGRRQERPMRRDRPFPGPAKQFIAEPLELVDAREPVLGLVARGLRRRIGQARV